jgi:phosphate transport system substrate-binding protein
MPFTVRNHPIHALSLVFTLATSAAAPTATVRAETLTVGGTGSAAPLVEQFAQAYGRIKPGITVRLINPPMGSNGSIRAALAGAIDLAVPGKPLTDAEKAQGGQAWELGRTPFLVVTSKQPPPPGLTSEQLAAIYRGQITAWADGSPIRLVLRSPTESDTLILRKLAPMMDAAVDAALARPGLLVAANDLENADLLEKTPGSLGAANLGLLQSQNRPLHALPINGAAPTLAALSEGSYPYFKSLYVMRGPTLSLTAQSFLEFVLSATGREVLDRAGYVPAPRQP